MVNVVNQQNKRLVWDYWQALNSARGSQLQDVVQRFVHQDSAWHGFDPILHLRGSDAIAKGFWSAFVSSFPDVRRDCHIFMGGASSGRLDGQGDGRLWVGGTGYFHATFQSDYLGIPATGKQVKIRWGEFCKVDGDQIVETYFQLDLIDLMQQAGCEVLPPSRGADGIYRAPAANDGVMLEAQDEAVSAHTLEHIRGFIFDGLNSYDESDLKSMGMADYFHPDVQWYGPGGIGACLSFKEFETYHQKHWLVAYPDRQVQDLNALFAEGPYSGGPGWAGVIATHTGEYLGVPATGKRIEINGIDFWKLEQDRYTENWVFVDMVHLFRQFGIDLFERLPR